MSYRYILRSWHIANAQWIYTKFSWPFHCMICFMSQTYLNQTFKNQELAGMDGKPDSTFISVSGLMFPASLPSFWPRFPSSSLFAWSKYKHNSCSDPDHLLLLIPAQQCLLLWPHLWNLMCDQGIPVRSQVGQAGIARSQSDIWLPWLSASHLGGPSRIGFHGLKYPMCCPLDL